MLYLYNKPDVCLLIYCTRDDSALSPEQYSSMMYTGSGSKECGMRFLIL